MNYQILMKKCRKTKATQLDNNFNRFIQENHRIDLGFRVILIRGIIKEKT